MTSRIALLAAAVAIAPAARAADGAAKKPASHQKASAVFLRADELKWGEAPPDLPRGGQVAVLHGDPSKHAPFAIRLKAPDGYKIAPHWHSQDEQLTIISGTLTLHMGDTMATEAHDLDAGSYHFLPGKMHHSAEAKGETVVQISGMGPFDIHYLNPADNPRNATAAGGGEAAQPKAAGRRP
jgi:mannose-6-phosphate isomerase-like protein (cupin superfamily)